MDMKQLKNVVEDIELSDTARERIARNCLAELSSNKEEPYMKKTRSLKRTLLIAAVLILCLPMVGLAVSNGGIFKDIKNIFGAVTGTEYENATDEITVSLSAEEKMLLVEAIFVNPDTPPYNACEFLSIDTYQVLDEEGTVIVESEETQPKEISNGKAVFCLPLEGLENGNYILQIDTFISEKKAEQPLPIHGNWEIPFSI